MEQTACHGLAARAMRSLLSSQGERSC